MWPLLLLVSATTLGCDTLGKQYRVYQVQAQIRREFHVRRVRVVVIDSAHITTHMLVALADSQHAALMPVERIAFAESVATFAVTHYQGDRITTVAFVLGMLQQGTGTRQIVVQPPIVFMPEYHPDGSIRLGLLPGFAPGPR
jgi:hypothetical protein